MKPKYGGKIFVCYIYTDSVLQGIETGDLYKDKGKMLNHFDTREYS